MLEHRSDTVQTLSPTSGIEKAIQMRKELEKFQYGRCEQEVPQTIQNELDKFGDVGNLVPKKGQKHAK